MAFDLSTARPAKAPGFESKGAKPVKVATPQERADLEARHAANETAAEQARAESASLGRIREPVRRIGQIATAPGRGILQIADLPGAAIEGIGRIAGADIDVPDFADLADDPSLAPQDAGERFERRALETLGGTMGGLGIGGRVLATAGQNTARRGIGEALIETPGRQMVAAGTGATAGQITEEAGGGPLAQMAATVVGGAPAFLGAAGRTSAAQAASDALPKPPAKTTTRPPQNPAEMVRGLGGTVTPSTRGARGGRLRESMLNPNVVEAENTIRNQRVWDENAAKEMGIGTADLPAHMPLSPERIAKAKAPHEAVYEAIRKANISVGKTPAVQRVVNQLGMAQKNNPWIGRNPAIDRLRERGLSAGDATSGEILDAIKELRANASGAWAAAETSANRAALQAQGKAQRQLADALEDALGDALKSFSAEGIEGLAPLAAQFPKARTALAKARNIEEAVVGGHLDMAKLAKLKEQGAPLSGRLNSMADTATMAPKETRHISKMQVPNPASITLFGNTKRMLQRAAHKLGVSRLEEPGFQNKQGLPLADEFFDDAAPDSGLLGPAAFLEQGVDLTPTDVPPAAALRGGPRDLELAPDTLHRGIAGMLESEPAPGRFGDLTASAPPAIEGIPFEGSDLAPISELTLAPEQGVGGFRGEKVPEEAALTEFVSDQPIERRRPGAEPYTGVERRKSIGDLLKEPGVRETEYQRHLENKTNIGVRAPDESLVSEQQAVREFMNRPGMRDEQRQISEENLAILRAQADAEAAIPPELPIGGQVAPETGGPIVPETGEFVRRSDVPEGDINEIGLFRSNADIGDMIGNQRVQPREGVLDISEQDLRDAGFTDEEIAQILAGQ